MPNTLDGLMPDIYEGMDIVSRELTGLIPAVTMNAAAERAALDTDITVNVEPMNILQPVVPGMEKPAPLGQATGTAKVRITRQEAASFSFDGNDQLSLNSSVGYANSRAGKIAQAVRSVINAVESDLAGLSSTFSRAIGTPGTTPFNVTGDNMDAALALKALKDNGGNIDAQLVIDTTAGANFIGKQSRADTAGTDTILRQGVLLNLAGMPLRESAAIGQNAVGTAAAYTTDGAAYPIGATEIVLDAGTGTILSGNTVSFAGDANKYVVATGVTAPDTVVIGAPGLRVAIPAAATAVTVAGSGVTNMCFSRSALHLVARGLPLPIEGDKAIDREMITDPRSGLSLEFAMYGGYRMVAFEVGLSWGVGNVKSEHTVLLSG